MLKTLILKSFNKYNKKSFYFNACPRILFLLTIAAAESAIIKVIFRNFYVKLKKILVKKLFNIFIKNFNFNVVCHKFQTIFVRNFSNTKVLFAKNKIPFILGHASSNAILFNKWGHKYSVNPTDLIFEPNQDGYYWCSDIFLKKYIVEIGRVRPIGYVFPKNVHSVILTQTDTGFKFTVETEYAIQYPYSARTHLWLYTDARIHYSKNNKNRYIICKTKATRLLD